MSGMQTVGFVEWRDDMDKLPSRAMAEGKKIVGQGCNNIKKDWRARWTGHAHIPHLPYAISYDVTVPRTNYIHGAAGPDLNKKQGPLGGIIEFGTINSAPIPGGLPAFEAESPRFLKFVEDMIPKLLEPKT